MMRLLPPPSIILEVRKVCSDNKKAVEFALGAVELMSSEIEEVDKNCLEEIDQLFKEVFENLKFANQRVEKNKELQRTLDENEIPSLEELPKRIRNNYTQILGTLRRVEYTLSNKDLKKTVIDAKRKIKASWTSLVKLEAEILSVYESIREKVEARLKKIQARKAKNGNKDEKNKNEVDLEDRVLLASQNPIRTVALIDQPKKEKEEKMDIRRPMKRGANANEVSLDDLSLKRFSSTETVSEEGSMFESMREKVEAQLKKIQARKAKNGNKDGKNKSEVNLEDRVLLASQNPIRTVALIDQPKKEKEVKMNFERSRKRGANANEVSSDDLASKRFSSTETVSRKPQALKAIVDGLSNEKNENEDGENENEVDMEDRELLASQNPIRTVALIDQSKKEKEEKMNIKRSRKRGANAINVSSDDLASKRFSSTETNNLLGNTKKQAGAEKEAEIKSDGDESPLRARKRHPRHTPSYRKQETPLKTIAPTSSERRRTRLFQKEVKEYENRETINFGASPNRHRILPHSSSEDLPRSVPSTSTSDIRHQIPSPPQQKISTGKLGLLSPLDKDALRMLVDQEMNLFQYVISDRKAVNNSLSCCGDARDVFYIATNIICDGAHGCGIVRDEPYKVSGALQYCLSCFGNRDKDTKKAQKGLKFDTKQNTCTVLEDVLKCSGCGKREYHAGCTWRFEKTDDFTFFCDVCQPNQHVITTLDKFPKTGLGAFLDVQLNAALQEVHEDFEKNKITTVVFKANVEKKKEKVGQQEDDADTAVEEEEVEHQEHHADAAVEEEKVGHQEDDSDTAVEEEKVGQQEGHADKAVEKVIDYTKHVIYVFQRQNDVDVLIFIMHTQEHIKKDENNVEVGWMVVDYLEAIHYVYPFNSKGDIFGNVITSYWDFMRTRGFSNSFFYAREPQQGETFCFNVRPALSHKLPQKSLEKWYIKLMEKAKELGIVAGFNTFKKEREAGKLEKSSDFPLFHDSLWPVMFNWAQFDADNSKGKLTYEAAIDHYYEVHAEDNFFVQMEMENDTAPSLDLDKQYEGCPKIFIDRDALMKWFNRDNLEFLSYRRTIESSVAFVRELNSYFSSLKKSGGKSKNTQ